MSVEIRAQHAGPYVLNVAKRAIGIDAANWVRSMTNDKELDIMKEGIALMFAGYQLFFPATTRLMQQEIDDVTDPDNMSGRRFVKTVLGFATDLGSNALIIAASGGDIPVMLAFRIGANTLAQLAMDSMRFPTARDRILKAE